MVSASRSTARVGLGVDVEAGVGKGGSRSASRGIGSLAGDPGLGDLGVRQLRDRPGPVGDPVQDAVVERQQHPVGGGVHIGLQIAVAQVHRLRERRAGCSPGAGWVGSAPRRGGRYAANGSSKYAYSLGPHGHIVRRPCRSRVRGRAGASRVQLDELREPAGDAGQQHVGVTEQPAAGEESRPRTAPARAATRPRTGLQLHLEPVHQPVRPLELAGPDGQAEQDQGDAAGAGHRAADEPEADQQQAGDRRRRPGRPPAGAGSAGSCAASASGPRAGRAADGGRGA